MINIGVLIYGESGKAFYRQIQPYTWMDRYYKNRVSVRFIQSAITFNASELFKDLHFVMLQGIHTGLPHLYSKIMDACAKLNIKVIYDIDDLDFKVSPNNPVYAQFVEKKLDEMVINCLKTATLVTTTTRKLANECREYNRNVYVFPNAMDYDYWYWNYPKKQDGWVRIGVITGSSHTHDMLKIQGIGKWIIEEFPNTKFVLGGYDSRCGSSIKDGMKYINYWEGKGNVWKDYISILLGKDYDKNRVEILKTQPIDIYPKLYSDLDVSLIPLKDNRFNASKSQLKIIESSVRSIPIVCSDTRSYEDIVSGVNGLMARSIPEWKSQIRRLVESEELRKQLGTRLHDDLIKTHDINIVSQKRIEILEKIMGV